MNKGSIGYIDQVKRKNLTYAIVGLSLMAVLYFTGLIVMGGNASSWTLIAVLLALPAAQFLTRNLSLRKFRSLMENERLHGDNLTSIAVAYELALVIGKHTHYVKMAVITDNQLSIYSDDSELTAKIVIGLLKQKGFLCRVQVYTDFDLFSEAIKKGTMMDEHQTKSIREMLINNAL